MRCVHSHTVCVELESLSFLTQPSVSHLPLTSVVLLCTRGVECKHAKSIHISVHIVSAHRRILGMASVVCVLVKICVSSISLYKLDTDKLTAPFESAHQFTLVCTVSDSKTVPGCHYNSCSNHSFVLTD